MISKFLLPPFAFLLLYLSYLAFTGGFNEKAISYESERSREWTIPEAGSEKLTEVMGILNQPFRYLSRGNQTYVFQSKDGKHVLKFFRFGHLKEKRWLTSLPAFSPIVRYRENKRVSQQKRLQRLFCGHWLAYTKDCDNCGLVFVHFPSDNNFNSKVTVTDRIGFKREIDLSKTYFVLQKKACVVRDALRLLLQKGEMEEVQRHIDRIFTLYLSEYEKGIFDRDYNVIDNVAFCEGKAMRIDVGKLRFDENIKRVESYSKDLEVKLVNRLKRWTKKYFPEKYPEVEAYLNKTLANYS